MPLTHNLSKLQPKKTLKTKTLSDPLLLKFKSQPQFQILLLCTWHPIPKPPNIPDSQDDNSGFLLKNDVPSIDSSIEDILAGKASAASSSTDKQLESFSSSASFKSPAYPRALHGVNVSGSLLIYRPNSI